MYIIQYYDTGENVYSLQKRIYKGIECTVGLLNN